MTTSLFATRLVREISCCVTKAHAVDVFFEEHTHRQIPDSNCSAAFVNSHKFRALITDCQTEKICLCLPAHQDNLVYKHLLYKHTTIWQALRATNSLACVHVLINSTSTCTPSEHTCSPPVRQVERDTIY